MYSLDWTSKSKYNLVAAIDDSWRQGIQGPYKVMMGVMDNPYEHR